MPRRRGANPALHGLQRPVNVTDARGVTLRLPWGTAEELELLKSAAGGLVVFAPAPPRLLSPTDKLWRYAEVRRSRRSKPSVTIWVILRGESVLRNALVMRTEQIIFARCKISS